MKTMELIVAVESAGGRIEANGDRLKVEVPKGVLTPQLRQELKSHKPELLRLLGRRKELHTFAGTDHPDLEELTAEYSRNGRIRIESDWAGVVWLVATPVLTEGHDGVKYTPKELRFMVNLSAHEREVTHNLKRQFGGTIEPRNQPMDE